MSISSLIQGRLVYSLVQDIQREKEGDNYDWNENICESGGGILGQVWKSRKASELWNVEGVTFQVQETVW